MARIFPTGWREIQAVGAAQRELETLSRLADGLPDSYTVYHGVHWTRVERGHSVFGEIDFVAISPAGRVLLIEQKSGFLEESAEGLCKRYGEMAKSVPVQLARTADGLRRRYAATANGAKLAMDILLYCPDYQVKQPAIAGIDPQRIVDSARRDRLVPIIREMLPEDEAEHPERSRAHKFFTEILDLVPDVRAMVGQVETIYTRLSGGLAKWGRQIECEPFRLRVIGTAGSGKTQLALSVFRDGLAAGRRPLFVCFNRPLADHFAAIVPAGGEVATYHQLCDRILSSAGRRPDFSQPEAFRRMEADFASLDPGEAWRFDVLIIDEGQDFPEGWRDALLRMLKPEGQAWWLEDPMQNLYGRAPVPLPGWVVLRSETNYRSPQDILRFLNRLVPEARQMEAGSPIDGSEVEIVTYASTAELIDCTKRAITQAVAAGFRRDMIAVITYRGREHSRLASYDRLGPHALRVFTGKYDLLGSPVFSEGEVLLESVYRFKGQSAPCVILTEIDFEELDELALRKLFVGATRATMKLVLILSEKAASVALNHLD